MHSTRRPLSYFLAETSFLMPRIQSQVMDRYFQISLSKSALLYFQILGPVSFIQTGQQVSCLVLLQLFSAIGCGSLLFNYVTFVYFYSFVPTLHSFTCLGAGCLSSFESFCCGYFLSIISLLLVQIVLDLLSLIHWLCRGWRWSIAFLYFSGVIWSFELPYLKLSNFISDSILSLPFMIISRESSYFLSRSRARIFRPETFFYR